MQKRERLHEIERKFQELKECAPVAPSTYWTHKAAGHLGIQMTAAIKYTMENKDVPISVFYAAEWIVQWRYRIMEATSDTLWVAPQPDGTYRPLTVGDVVLAYYRAGRRINRRFVAAILEIVSREDDEPRLWKEWRAARWLTVYCEYYRYWCADTVFPALADLPLLARRAAIMWPMGGRPRLITPDGLNWPLVERARQMMARNNWAKLAALAPSPGRAALMVSRATGRTIRPDELRDFFAPGYCHLDEEAARTLAVMTPVEYSGGQLTGKEAHEWLLDGATMNPAVWLAWKHGLVETPSVKILRWQLWLKASEERWAAFWKERRRVVYGEVFDCSVADFVEEGLVRDDDIQTGQDGVGRVWERVLDRIRAERRQQFVDDYGDWVGEAPEWVRELPEGVRLLNSFARLEAETDAMGHCLISYVGAIAQGELFAFSIVTEEGRSTFGVFRDGTTQHTGPENTDPPAANEAVAEQVLDIVARRLGLSDQ